MGLKADLRALKARNRSPIDRDRLVAAHHPDPNARERALRRIVAAHICKGDDRALKEMKADATLPAHIQKLIEEGIPKAQRNLIAMCIQKGDYSTLDAIANLPKDHSSDIRALAKRNVLRAAQKCLQDLRQGVIDGKTGIQGRQYPIGIAHELTLHAAYGRPPLPASHRQKAARLLVELLSREGLKTKESIKENGALDSLLKLSSGSYGWDEEGESFIAKPSSDIQNRAKNAALRILGSAIASAKKAGNATALEEIARWEWLGVDALPKGLRERDLFDVLERTEGKQIKRVKLFPEEICACRVKAGEQLVDLLIAAGRYGELREMVGYEDGEILSRAFYRSMNEGLSGKLDEAVIRYAKKVLPAAATNAWKKAQIGNGKEWHIMLKDTENLSQEFRIQVGRRLIQHYLELGRTNPKRASEGLSVVAQIEAPEEIRTAAQEALGTLAKTLASQRGRNGIRDGDGEMGTRYLRAVRRSHASPLPPPSRPRLVRTAGR